MPDSLAVGIEATGVKWGSLLVKIGALGGLTSTMVVMLLGQSRVFFSMSKDGLLPKVFSNVHPKFRTPWISSITVGLVVAVFASTIPLDALGEMTSIGTLLAFIIVCAGVLGTAEAQPGAGKTVPCTVHAGDCHPGHPDLAGIDARTSAGDVDTVGCVARGWIGDLLQLW